MDSAGSVSLVADPVVGRAVSGIVPNADQQQGWVLLERTFVDIGVLDQLDSPNSQVLFGRRGTGKSHLLRLLTARRNLQAAQAAVFVDVRRLGSAQLMTNPAKPLTLRSVSVFRDLLAQLQGYLLDLATDPLQPERIDALESVSILADTIASVSSNVAAREITAETDTSARRSSKLSATAAASPSVAAGFTSETTDSTKFSEHYTQVFEDTIIFSEIANSLEQVLSTLGISKLVLVLDEWSAIPPDVQPYVAEFLKRTLLPSPRMSLKIGSLAYGSVFAITNSGVGRIGFEFGAEITRNIDLDEQYAFESHPNQAIGIFTDLLWRHVVANIPEPDYLQDRYGIQSPEDLRNRLFKADDSFTDLLRAAAGVARDFLSIFTVAYFRSAVARTFAIESEAVRYAARSSFRTEKLLNLDGEQERVLQRIAEFLRGRDTGNLFLLGRSSLANTMIQSLFDLRVIHMTQRYYTSDMISDQPFALYSLDYGASLAWGPSPPPPTGRSGLANNTVPRPGSAPPILDISRIIPSS